MGTISAKFEVKTWDESPLFEDTAPPKLTRASVTKQYSGDIDGVSSTEWLMAYAEDGTATFVGVEQVEATIAGRAGSLVLLHDGKFEDGAATATLTVAKGSGTEGFVSASGIGSFLADPAGSVELDLTFD
jgi:hypothetical protein